MFVCMKNKSQKIATLCLKRNGSNKKKIPRVQLTHLVVLGLSRKSKSNEFYDCDKYPSGSTEDIVGCTCLFQMITSQNPCFEI